MSDFGFDPDRTGTDECDQTFSLPGAQTCFGCQRERGHEFVKGMHECSDEDGNTRGGWRDPGSIRIYWTSPILAARVAALIATDPNRPIDVDGPEPIGTE